MDDHATSPFLSYKVNCKSFGRHLYHLNLKLLQVTLNFLKMDPCQLLHNTVKGQKINYDDIHDVP